MREPFWNTSSTVLFHDDPGRVLADMPNAAVDCIVTELPLWGLTDLGTEGRYGHEPTPGDHVAAMKALLGAASRVLADDGTLWLGISDCYANDAVWGEPTGQRLEDGSGIPARSLIGLPWRIALALQADGWTIRNAVVWFDADLDSAETTRERLAGQYELVFLLVKRRRYWFDLDALREPLARPDLADQPPPVGGIQGAQGAAGSSGWRHPGHGKYRLLPGKRHGTLMRATGRRHSAARGNGKNPGDVWPIRLRDDRHDHFAGWPLEVPLRCIAAGCRPGGTVMDLFAGTATVGIAARQLDRRYIGVEPSEALCQIAKARLTQQPGPGDPPWAS